MNKIRETLTFMERTCDFDIELFVSTNFRCQNVDLNEGNLGPIIRGRTLDNHSFKDFSYKLHQNLG